MLKLIVCGICGRMGTALLDLVRESEDFSIVAGVDNNAGVNSKEFTQNPVLPVFPTIEKVCIDADCVISFMPPTATYENMALLEYCIKTKLPVVIGTTGLSGDFLHEMEKASESTAVLYSSNMSYGVNLVLEIVSRFSGNLIGEGFHVEIVEAHHGRKIDAPSGTALKLADTINKTVDIPMGYVYDRSKTSEARRDDEIGIQSLRGGGIFGEHKIVFAGEHEVVEVSHRALSRQVFASGALKAAKFLKGKTPGMYYMKDLMENDNA